MTYTHAVQFDATYIDGTLSGLTVPGQIIRYPSWQEAERARQKFAKLERAGEPLTACMTGNRYKPSNAIVFQL